MDLTDIAPLDAPPAFAQVGLPPAWLRRMARAYRRHVAPIDVLITFRRPRSRSHPRRRLVRILACNQLERAKAPADFVPFTFALLRYPRRRGRALRISGVPDDHYTPLQLAARRDGSADGGLVRVLIDAGCDVEGRG